MTPGGGSVPVDTLLTYDYFWGGDSGAVGAAVTSDGEARAGGGSGALRPSPALTAEPPCAWAGPCGPLWPVSPSEDRGWIDWPTSWWRSSGVGGVG